MFKILNFVFIIFLLYSKAEETMIQSNSPDIFNQLSLAMKDHQPTAECAENHKKDERNAIIMKSIWPYVKQELKALKDDWKNLELCKNENSFKKLTNLEKLLFFLKHLQYNDFCSLNSNGNDSEDINIGELLKDIKGELREIKEEQRLTKNLANEINEIKTNLKTLSEDTHKLITESSKSIKSQVKETTTLANTLLKNTDEIKKAQETNLVEFGKTQKLIQEIPTPELNAFEEKIDEKIEETLNVVDDKITIQGNLLKNISNLVTEFNNDPVKTVHPTSCVDVPNITSIYAIKIPSVGLRKVPCDADYHGGGWLVFQRRKNGKVSFQRNWQEYKEGFGDLEGDYWLGLEKLYQITKAQPQELLIVFEDWDDNIEFVLYDGLAIGSEANKYRLNSPKIKSKSLIEFDSFSYHFNRDFTTDSTSAKVWTGGWWGGSSYGANLNGLYPNEEQRKSNCRKCMNWAYLKYLEDPLKFVQMMIRPMKTH